MYKEDLAYIIGVSLGDGNLSNPNGRAVRLRVSCGTTYPGIIERIFQTLQRVFPKNKVTIVRKQKTSCVDISCYSNQLETLLGWKALGGSKFKQRVCVPNWIRQTKKYSIMCLRGLLETDGSLYKDRGYSMVNFTSIIYLLAKDVTEMIEKLGFHPHCYTIQTKHNTKYVVRISKNVPAFLKIVGCRKN